MDARCFNSLFGHVWACLTMPSPKKKKKKKKKKKLLVSGNVGGEKNLQPGGRKFIFF